jgi:hypothetical protein
VPKNSRVIVRIYADLQALSFSAGKSGLISKKSGPRALAPFAFQFSQVSPFFDFTDVGDRHFVKIKISGMCPITYFSCHHVYLLNSENFKVFLDDPQCKLLLFGVGLSLIYLDMLSSYREQEKVVLIPDGPLNTKFKDLGLNAVQFEEVFRVTDLSYQSPGLHNKGNTMPSNMNKIVPQSVGAHAEQSSEIYYKFRDKVGSHILPDTLRNLT